MIHIFADSIDQSTGNTMLGFILIGLVVAAFISSRSPAAKKAIGRSARSIGLGAVKATSRPVRSIGRRSRSGVIGRWGRSVVACEDRSIAAAKAGKHGKARWYRSVGDAMVGSSRISCHVPGCDWSQDPPQLGAVVAHLRWHRDQKAQAEAEESEKKKAASSPKKSASEKTPEPPPPSENKAPSPQSPQTMAYIPPKFSPPHAGYTPNYQPEQSLGVDMSVENIHALAYKLDNELIPAEISKQEIAAAKSVEAGEMSMQIASMQETMASLHLPADALAKMSDAHSVSEQVRIANAQAAAMHSTLVESLQAMRESIRGQESVAEVAAASGGAMERQAYGS